MTRTLAFDPNGWQDYVYWHTRDRETLERIDRLVYYVTDDHRVVLQGCSAGLFCRVVLQARQHC